MKRSTKILLGIFITRAVIVLVAFSYIDVKLDSIYIKDNESKVELKKDEQEGKMVDGITNALLVGIYGTNIDKGNRSDAMNYR